MHMTVVSTMHQLRSLHVLHRFILPCMLLDSLLYDQFYHDKVIRWRSFQWLATIMMRLLECTSQ